MFILEATVHFFVNKVQGVPGVSYLVRSYHCPLNATISLVSVRQITVVHTKSLVEDDTR